MCSARPGVLCRTGSNGRAEHILQVHWQDAGNRGERRVDGHGGNWHQGPPRYEKAGVGVDLSRGGRSRNSRVMKSRLRRQTHRARSTSSPGTWPGSAWPSAGAQLMTWFGVACELHRDWRNEVEGVGVLFANHIPDCHTCSTAPCWRIVAEHKDLRFYRESASSSNLFRVDLSSLASPSALRCGSWNSEWAACGSVLIHQAESLPDAANDVRHHV
jgi:hypothetical protein